MKSFISIIALLLLIYVHSAYADFANFGAVYGNSTRISGVVGSLVTGTWQVPIYSMGVKLRLTAGGGYGACGLQQSSSSHGGNGGGGGGGGAVGLLEAIHIDPGTVISYSLASLGGNSASSFSFSRADVGTMTLTVGAGFDGNIGTVTSLGGNGGTASFSLSAPLPSGIFYYGINGAKGSDGALYSGSTGGTGGLGGVSAANTALPGGAGGTSGNVGLDAAGVQYYGVGGSGGGGGGTNALGAANFQPGGVASLEIWYTSIEEPREEYWHTTTLTGPWSTDPTATIVLVKRGNVVTGTLTSDVTGTFTTNAAASTTVPIPERFRPISPMTRAFNHLVDNVGKYGSVDINPNGILTFRNGANSGTFTSSSTVLKSTWVWSLF